jgi:hypothetical protein
MWRGTRRGKTPCVNSPSSAAGLADDIPVTTYTQAEQDAYETAQDKNSAIIIGGASPGTPATGMAIPKWLLILPLGLAAVMMFKGKGGGGGKRRRKATSGRKRAAKRARRVIKPRKASKRKKSAKSIIWTSPARRRAFARFGG